jgi:outer membrane protein assembly factor BamB
MLPPELHESNYVPTLIQQAEFQKELTGGKFAGPVRRLVGLWLLRPCSLNTLYVKLNLALHYDVPEGLDVALTILREQKQAHGHYRAQAITAVGLLGGKPWAAALLPLLEDKTELYRGSIRNQLLVAEVRDIALAWLVHLTDQDHAAYEMEQVKTEFQQLGKRRRYHVNYTLLGFADGAKREAALAKWKSHLSANPLPEPPARPLVKLVADHPPRGVMFGGNPLADSQRLTPLAGGKLPLADRLEVQSLARARTLADRGHYAESARLLGELLAKPEDAAFQPDAKISLFRSLKAEAERALGEMPAEGLTAYRLQFATLARSLLTEAIRVGKVAELEAVAERFFHTEAGAAAVYLLGSYYLDHGQPLRGALHLERLRSGSRDAEQFEPALSLKLAVAWWLGGMTDEAEGVLQEVARRHPQAIGQFSAGTPAASSDGIEQPARWLAGLTGISPSPQQAQGWPMYRGAPHRNFSCNSGAPYLHAQSVSLAATPPALKDILHRLRQEQQEQYRAVLPRLHPLVVGKTVLARSATHLHAFDFASGQLLWAAALEDSLRRFLWSKGQGPAMLQQALQSEHVRRGLKRRLWEDLGFGTLSSDGRAVFGIEDVAFGFGAEYRQLSVSSNGQRRLDVESLKRYNLLTAHDVGTGKLRWELGGPPGPGVLPLAGARFLGPPLPLGQRLYVVAEIDDRTQLVELESASGTVLSHLTLRLNEPHSQAVMGMTFPFPPEAVFPAPVRLAASPAYADGILVCPLGDNQYCGVHLASRSVRWFYQVPERELGPRHMAWFNPWGAVFRDAANEQSAHWLEGSVTLAAGRALLASPDSDQLICLRLEDGGWEWSALRDDGLYVAGVQEGQVLIVGRGHVWALRLADGKPAWPHHRLPLPAGALPSGIGFLGEGRYYLPLSSGEVATINLRQGRIVARSRSPAGLVPGNLVACQGAIFSQQVDGLWRFDTLAAREQQLRAELAQRAEDVALLRERAEILLCDGRLDEALAVLRRLLELQPDNHARQLLLDALLEGLRVDFRRFAQQAEEAVSLAAGTPRHAAICRELAAGWSRAGQQHRAFNWYLQLVGQAENPEETERVEAPRLVRRDRWLAARLAEVRAAAREEERTAIDAAITTQLADDKLADFLRYFAAHPAAHAVRLRHARQLRSRQQWLAAEQLLMEVKKDGSPAERCEALAEMVLLLREANLPEDAAYWYRQLRQELGAKGVPPGLSEETLLKALPPDDPIRRQFVPPVAWGKKIEVHVDERPANIPPRNPLYLVVAEDWLGGALSCECDVQSRRLLCADDWGRIRWALPIADDQHWGFINYQLPYSQLWTRGHLLIAWLGNRIYAFDVSGPQPQLRWQEEVFPLQRHPNFGIIGWPMRRRLIGGGLPGSEVLPVVVGNTGIYFLQQRNLLAREPLTGKLLWRRDDVPADATLFGDDELLFVTPPQESEAVVYDARDGRELGRRPVPPAEERLWNLGRRIAVWKAAAEKCEMSLVDPWEGRLLWQRTFDSQSQTCLITQDEAAVLDPQGRFVVVALPSGREILANHVEPLAELDQIYVQRSADSYLLVASSPTTGQNIFMQNQFLYIPVNGALYSFDRSTGKLRWTRKVEEQGMRIDQPSNLPVLVLFNSTYRVEGNSTRTQSKLLCLDKRSGEVLFEKNVKDYRGHQHILEVNPVHRQVVFHSVLGTIKLTFAEP